MRETGDDSRRRRATPVKDRVQTEGNPACSDPIGAKTTAWWMMFWSGLAGLWSATLKKQKRVGSGHDEWSENGPWPSAIYDSSTIVVIGLSALPLSNGTNGKNPSWACWMEERTRLHLHFHFCSGGATARMPSGWSTCQDLLVVVRDCTQNHTGRLTGIQ